MYILPTLKTKIELHSITRIYVKFVPNIHKNPWTTLAFLCRDVCAWLSVRFLSSLPPPPLSSAATGQSTGKGPQRQTSFTFLLCITHPSLFSSALHILISSSSTSYPRWPPFSRPRLRHTLAGRPSLAHPTILTTPNRNCRRIFRTFPAE